MLDRKSVFLEIERILAEVESGSINPDSFYTLSIGRGKILSVKISDSEIKRILGLIKSEDENS